MVPLHQIVHFESAKSFSFSILKPLLVGKSKEEEWLY